MIEVPRKNTPITAQQAVTALLSNWTGEPLTQQQATLLLSLAWIETAQGKAVQNFSPGNVSASEKWPGKAWRPPWYPEQGPDATPRNISLHAAMLKGQAPSAFRAFDTIDQGFKDWIGTLHSSFPEVIEAAKTGDADAFRVALSKKYSGDYKNTKATATFQSFQKTFLPMLSSLPTGAATTSTPLEQGSESAGFLSELPCSEQPPSEEQVTSVADEFLSGKNIA